MFNLVVSRYRYGLKNRSVISVNHSCARPETGASADKKYNLGERSAPDDDRSNVINDSLFEICSANIAINIAVSKILSVKIGQVLQKMTIFVKLYKIINENI